MNELDKLATELSSLMGIPITPDRNHVCQLKFNQSNISVRLELDVSQNLHTLIISVNLGPIGAPTYKERIFDAALSINASFSNCGKGILCYGEVSDSLYIYEKINLELIQAKKIHERLLEIQKHASIWAICLPKGETPDLRELGIS
ncbi:Uncharacterized protein CLAVI_000841 [Candidatus Clavichlamydia salmonicola]|uniref:CesT family type III secretion system chaperone n=1 Tax=Candidatus Clavichlamydia salmonicola TaxID=469812 RepID=UPI0018910974|nr:CesT family type III secretion system chaperone [Candidatus Clavichlamydia salmonicola]MBF5051203.1 Uncharacterized protein [Candidatus Clavichlamydia salmonicola]